MNTAALIIFIMLFASLVFFCCSVEADGLIPQGHIVSSSGEFDVILNGF